MRAFTGDFLRITCHVQKLHFRRVRHKRENVECNPQNVIIFLVLAPLAPLLRPSPSFLSPPPSSPPPPLFPLSSPPLLVISPVAFCVVLITYHVAKT